MLNDLAIAINACHEGVNKIDNPSSLLSIPGMTFSYWASAAKAPYSKLRR